jgi:HEPN domain-containing protein/predicted nucleotidyltransferase
MGILARGRRVVTRLFWLTYGNMGEGAWVADMLATLEEVVERLVSRYDPDRIILFGSHASGRAREGSDLDLLIVKETPLRPIDRRVEVERLLADRQVPLDLLVYTPQEVRDLYALGSPFIEEVVETGRVLYMRKPTASWLRDAEDGRETASILMEHGKYRGTCFHSQQCVENALKALVIEKGKRPARTHEIIELLNGARAEGWTLSPAPDEAVFLNSVYRGRYPTEEGLLPHGEPTEADARRALSAAETLLSQVKGAITKFSP